MKKNLVRDCKIKIWHLKKNLFLYKNFISMQISNALTIKENSGVWFKTYWKNVLAMTL